ncbi:MAG: hypothetical protein IPP69_03475 [Flavobacteriales bacterium]|nr:hypothetical protein [Flavobacteriales bacterium]
MKSEGNILQKDIQRRKDAGVILINTLAVVGAVVLFTLLGFVGKNNTIPFAGNLMFRWRP